MKKITKDIRFLIAIFVLVFVAFGGLAINAIFGAGGESYSPYVGQGGTPAETVAEDEDEDEDEDEEEAVAEAFNFKAPVLRLGLDGEPNTSFLVITDGYEIVGVEVSDTSVVYVEITPEFKIIVVGVGEAEIRLSAKKSDGGIKTIMCTVIVEGEAETEDDDDEDEDHDEDDEDDETVIPIIAKLRYSSDFPLSYYFNLVVSQGDRPEFWVLDVAYVKGDVDVRIIERAANIEYLKAATGPAFKIKFVAMTVEGEVLATKIVRNRL